jgi:hypothetical protein
VQVFYLMPEVLQLRYCYQLQLLASGDGLLLACLLLLVQLLGLVLLLLDLLLVAGPSPPGLDLELQFISIVLLDDF